MVAGSACCLSPHVLGAVSRAGRPGHEWLQAVLQPECGVGLPACLPVSECLSSEKRVVFVPLHPLLRLLIFEHLIMGEKLV